MEISFSKIAKLPLFVRICYSHATNMSICNAIIGLKILILNAVELQIRQNEAIYFPSLCEQ